MICIPKLIKNNIQSNYAMLFFYVNFPVKAYQKKIQKIY